MLLHVGLCERQAQTGSVGATGDEGEEDLFNNVSRNAWSVVDDKQFQCQFMALFTQGNLPGYPRAQGDACIAARNAFPQGLCGVVGDVEHGLDEMFPVSAEFGIEVS